MKVAMRHFVALMGILAILWISLLPAEAGRRNKPPGNSRKPSLGRSHSHHEVPRNVIVQHIVATGKKRIRARLGHRKEGDTREAEPGLDFGNESGFRIGSKSEERSSPSRSHSDEPVPSFRAETFRAETNDFVVRQLIVKYVETGIPAKDAAETLRESYLWPYLKAALQPHRTETDLVSSDFRDMAKKAPDEAKHAVETVYITLLPLVGKEGDAEWLQEPGGLEPLLARRIPPAFKALKGNRGETTVNPDRRWSILDDWTVDTIKYLMNNKYRDRKKTVSYQDQIQPSDSVQRGSQSKRTRAQDIREWLKNDDFREWSATNATEWQRLVLKDLSRGETYSWIAKEHGISTKTIQRMMSDFWNMAHSGIKVEKKEYTEKFKELIFRDGSDRQRRILIALSENKTHSSIAEKEQCSTKTIQREIGAMEKMARDAAVLIHASISVRQVRPFPFPPNPAVE